VDRRGGGFVGARFRAGKGKEKKRVGVETRARAETMNEHFEKNVEIVFNGLFSAAIRYGPF
jgi:hypothetical protein